VSTTPSNEPTRILCLGEALVDLICQHPADGPAQAGSFVPHFGGAVANVAIGIARAGGGVALAGGVGNDAWGEWLRDRLDADGVDTSLFQLIDGLPTPLALVTVDESGDATYSIYNQGIGTIVPGLRAQLDQAIEESGALFFSSNTLVGEEERELTMHARELALARELPVIFDPNLRLPRWETRADAQASANACVPGALLVRLNLEEAQLMTGEQDPERAATALLKAGARMVALTLGTEGAILRGEFHTDVEAVEANLRSTIGAGDAFTAALLSQLQLTAYYPPAVPASMRAAAAAAAAACERWGAVD
jgi:sugar/nucleoside kinase (ribokinase family)